APRRQRVLDVLRDRNARARRRRLVVVTDVLGPLLALGEERVLERPRGGGRRRSRRQRQHVHQLNRRDRLLAGRLLLRGRSGALVERGDLLGGGLRLALLHFGLDVERRELLLNVVGQVRADLPALRRVGDVEARALLGLEPVGRGGLGDRRLARR